MMLWFFSLHAYALPPAPKVIATYSVPQLAQRELCYPSGLRAHLVEQPASGLAAVASVVGAGTASEGPGQRSAAHMVEHLWFHARPDGGLRIWDRAAGLDVAASTHHDVTTYTSVGSPVDLEGLLQLEAARLTDPLAGVTEADLALERRVVRDELLHRGEHGVRMAISHLDGMLFPEGHPYRHTIATGADVDALDLDGLRGFADEHYVPGRTTVSVEAARSLDDQQALFEAAFQPLLAGAAAGCDHPRSDEPPPPPVAPGTMKRAEAPVRGKQVYLAWSLPASWGPDHTYETLTAPQLSRVIRSRLPFARGLKGDQSDASLGCQYLPGRVAARMLCRIDLPAQADAQHVVELVIGSLDAQWGISAREQQDRVRQLSNLVASTFQQALAQSDDLSVDGAEARAHQRHVVGTTAPVVAELDQALAVDPDRLARTAATWLTAERAAILVVEPGAAVSDDREDLPRLEAKLNATGTPSWRPSDPPLDVQRSTLANGLQVVRSYRGAAPATRMALERPVGELLAPDGARFYWDSAAVYRMPGVSFTDLRKEAGVSSWEALDLGGSSLHAFSSDGSSGLAAWSLRVWLDSLSMDPAYVQTSVDRALETLEGDLATWPLLHTRSLRAAHLFPDHPWARPWWQDVALARKTRQGEVMKWRKAMDRADLATLLVVSPDDGALTAADKYLSKWKGSNGEPAPAPTVPAPPADRRVMALATDDLLTDVRVECRLAPKTDANDAAHEVLGALLRRGVWQTLREGGGSYAPSATTKVPGPGLASMELQAQVPRTHAPAATLALLDLLALVAAGIDDDVLASARLDAAGAHARRHASTLAHFHSLHQRAQSGLSIDAIAGYRERIDNVDAAAVTELLADCVGHEAVTVVGANPAPGLEAAGLAPVDIDWRQRAVDEARSVR